MDALDDVRDAPPGAPPSRPRPVPRMAYVGGSRVPPAGLSDADAAERRKRRFEEGPSAAELEAVDAAIREQKRTAFADLHGRPSRVSREPPSSAAGGADECRIEVWHIFSGEERASSVTAHARALGASSAYDVDIKVGGPTMDMTSEPAFGHLLRAVAASQSPRVLLGPPCRILSVARTRPARRRRRADGSYLDPPRPLADTAHPDGLPDLSAAERAELDQALTLAARALELARAAHRAGGVFVLEHPVSRARGFPHHVPKWGERAARHLSLWQLPMTIEFIAATGAVCVDIAQGAFGLPAEKLTTLAVSPRLPGLIEELRRRGQPYGPGGGRGGGGYVGFDSDGCSRSSVLEQYPGALCETLARHLVAYTPPSAYDEGLGPVPTTLLPTREAGPVTVVTAVAHSDTAVFVLLPRGPDSRLFGGEPPAGTPPYGEARLALAEAWLRTLVGDDSLLASLAGSFQAETDGGTAATFTTEIHLRDSAGDDALPSVHPTAEWACVRQLELAGDSRHEWASCTAATIGVLIAPRRADTKTLRVGIGEARAVRPDIRDDTAGRAFNERAAAARREERRLAEALRSYVDGPPQLRSFLTSCADRVISTDGREVPVSLHEMVRSFDHPGLRLQPFVHRAPVETVPQAPPIPLSPTATAILAGERPHPEREEDIFEATFLTALDEYMREYARYHCARMDGDAGAVRPPPFAADETAVKPAYRGCYIDLRGGVGAIRVMDPNVLAGRFHIQHEAVLEALADLPDKELVSFWGRGVTFQAGMPLWVVIHPNLLNFWDGLEAATAQLQEFRELGWLRGSDPSLPPERRCRLPSVPFFAQPRGAVPKKLGEEPRIIIDMGAPRKPLWARSFDPDLPGGGSARAVPALNERAVCSVKEAKPSAADAALNTAVLCHAAEISGIGLEPIELHVDWMKYFHQFVYTFEQSCCDGSVAPFIDTDGNVSRTLLSELSAVMAMGGKPASLVGQRASNATNRKVLARMDEAETAGVFAAEDSPALVQWRADRDGLPHDSYGTQARLCDVLTFTDDPRAVAVGVLRAVRLLVEIWDLCGRTIGLRFSKPEKWILGASGTWVGVRFSGVLGIAWIPAEKALRALGELADANAGLLTAELWRRMMGFLEHVWSLLRRDRHVIDILWQPCGRGGVLTREGPAARVVPAAEERRMLARCAYVITNYPGVSLLATVEPERPVAESTTVWLLAGDAAREPDDLDAGLGHALYHLWTHMQLSQDMLDAFDTPHLEFIQLVMMFLTHAEGRLQHAQCVLLECDALATPVTLVKRARTPLMRALLGALLAHPVYRRFLQPAGRLQVRQRRGLANGRGDAASRNQLDRLRRLSEQLGLGMQRIEYSETALRFLDDVLALPIFQARVATARAGRGPGVVTPPGRATSHRPAWSEPAPPEGLAESLRARIAIGMADKRRAGHQAARPGWHEEVILRTTALGSPYPVLKSQPLPRSLELCSEYLRTPAAKVGPLLRGQHRTGTVVVQASFLRWTSLGQQRDQSVLRLAELLLDGRTPGLRLLCGCRADLSMAISRCLVSLSSSSALSP